MKRGNLIFSACICLIIACITFLLLSSINQRTHRIIDTSTPDETKPWIALTFDDGPNLNYTPQLLTLLYEEQTVATFFLIGEKIPANKQLVQEIYYNGHEIGNHTFSHQDLTTLERQQIQQEIQQTEAELNQILPNYTIQYIRPPYGHTNGVTEKCIGQSQVLWTIDSHDWEDIDADTIYHYVVDHAKDQDIVVFHDDNEETINALEKIIPELKRRGFEFVTISQLKNKAMHVS